MLYSRIICAVWYPQDFATSSLKGEVAEENDQNLFEDNELDQYQIVERKLWEQRCTFLESLKNFML